MAFPRCKQSEQWNERSTAQESTRRQWRCAPGISVVQASNGDCDELREARREHRLIWVGIGEENVNISPKPSQYRRFRNHEDERRRTRGLARATYAATAWEIRTRGADRARRTDVIFLGSVLYLVARVHGVRAASTALLAAWLRVFWRVRVVSGATRGASGNKPNCKSISRAIEDQKNPKAYSKYRG